MTINNYYSMVTAELSDTGLHFSSDEAFNEALRVGFFRIPTPKDIDLKVGRAFASTFPSDPTYSNYGKIDHVNGYLTTESFQLIRFELDRERWGVFPKEVQKLGHQLHGIGVKILLKILERSDIPKDLWSRATSKASECGGQHLLSFCNYDPKNGDKPYGLSSHKDWTYLTVVDVHQEGLQAQIDGQWKTLVIEDGYLTVNFGIFLEKLIPQVKASLHRVVTQTQELRTSTVAFLCPKSEIYDWDSEKKELINEKSMKVAFDELNKVLESYHD